MTTEEKIAVMQAFVEEKEVEILINDEWETMTISNPTWGWGADNYRIKQEPEYIPFDFSDAESLIGKVVKSKHSGNIFLISGYDSSEDYFIVGNTTQTFYQLFNDCTFLDGSPCGKLKQ
jgi:hypothetical protein